MNESKSVQRRKAIQRGEPMPDEVKEWKDRVRLTPERMKEIRNEVLDKYLKSDRDKYDPDELNTLIYEAQIEAQLNKIMQDKDTAVILKNTERELLTDSEGKKFWGNVATFIPTAGYKEE